MLKFSESECADQTIEPSRRENGLNSQQNLLCDLVCSVQDANTQLIEICNYLEIIPTEGVKPIAEEVEPNGAMERNFRTMSNLQSQVSMLFQNISRLRVTLN